MMARATAEHETKQKEEKKAKKAEKEEKKRRLKAEKAEAARKRKEEARGGSPEKDSRGLRRQNALKDGGSYWSSLAMKC